MFDHLGIVSCELSTSREFYISCLAPLGITLLQDNSTAEGDGWLVFGTIPNAPFLVVAAGRPSFWTEPNTPAKSPVQFAFSAGSKDAVDQFHLNGFESGGVDNGPAGFRQPNCYAAYLLDPDGNNVEAFFRE